MNASQFAKAYKLFDRVKELDAEILEIEKTAQMIADKKTEIKLSLKVNDLEKPTDSEKVKFDEDGSLVNGSSRGMYISLFSGYLRASEPEKEKQKCDILHDDTIPDRVALQILGVLLADKTAVRDLAIKQLNKIGVAI